MKKVVFSHHALVDRADRIAYIATTVGFGEILFKIWDEVNNNYKCVTDTGVIIVQGEDETIITMYIGGYNQMMKLFKGDIPKSIKDIVQRNEKRKHVIKQNGG